jgi:hypothetical protein
MSAFPDVLSAHGGEVMTPISWKNEFEKHPN